MDVWPYTAIITNVRTQKRYEHTLDGYPPARRWGRRCTHSPSPRRRGWRGRVSTCTRARPVAQPDTIPAPVVAAHSYIRHTPRLKRKSTSNAEQEVRGWDTTPTWPEKGNGTTHATHACQRCKGQPMGLLYAPSTACLLQTLLSLKQRSRGDRRRHTGARLLLEKETW